MESKRIIYHGSANSVPKHGITMTDGDILVLPEHTADRLVGENIGFSFVKEEKPSKKEIKKVK